MMRGAVRATFRRPLLRLVATFAAAALVAPLFPPGHSVSADTDVTCPTYSVVRVDAVGAICALEREVVEELAAERGVPLDTAQEHELYTHGRSVIRARLLARLLAIVDDTTRTSAEQGAHDWLAQQTTDVRRSMATRSLELYQQWVQDPCSFTPPAGFTYEPPEALCIETTALIQIFQTPRPPTFDEFVAYGFVDVLTRWGTDSYTTDAERLSNDWVGSVIGGAIGTAAVGGSAVALYGISALQAAVFPFHYGAGAGAAAFGTFTIAVGAAVLAVVSIILLAVSIAQAIGDFSIPVKLRDNLDAIPAGATNLPAFLAAEGDPGMAAVAAGFLAGTSGPVSLPGTFSPPAASDAESPFFRTYVPSGPGANVALVPAYVQVLEYYDWEGELRRAWLHDRWWVSEPAGGGGPRTLSPMLRMRGFGDEPIGVTFDGLELTIARLDDDDPIDCPGADCVTGKKLQYMTTADQDGVDMELTTAELSSGTPVITSFTIPTEILEGVSQTYRAEATDPDGDALTFTWIFERESVWVAGLFTRSEVVGQEITTKLWGAGEVDVVLEVSDPAGVTATRRTTMVVTPEPLDALTYEVVRPFGRPGPLSEGDIFAGYESGLASADWAQLIVSGPNGTQIGVDHDGDGVRDDFRTVRPDEPATFPLIGAYVDDFSVFADDGVIPIGVTAADGDATLVETYPLEVVPAGPTDLEVELWDGTAWVAARPQTGAGFNQSTPAFPIPELVQGDLVRVRFRVQDPGPDDVTATVFWLGARDVVGQVPDGEWRVVERRFDLDHRDPQVTLLGQTIFGPLVQVTAVDDDGAPLQSALSPLEERVAFYDMANVPTEVRDLVAADVGDGLIGLSGAIFDASLRDVRSAIVDWGDGTTERLLPSAVATAGQLLSFDLRHQYASGGEYEVRVITIDGDPRETRETAITVTASSRAPVIDAIADAPDTELAVAGTPSRIALVVADGDHPTADLSVTVDFGTGPVPASYDADRDLFVVDRTFETAGFYDLTAVAEDLAGVESAPFEARIAINTPPVISDLTATPGRADEGSAIEVSGTISELVVSSGQATVDWGDGSPPAAVDVDVDGDGAGAFAASHTYTDDGTFTVVVTPTDDFGLAGDDATVDVTIDNVDPTIRAAELVEPDGTALASWGVVIDTDLELRLDLEDPAGADDPLQVTVDWGDGTTSGPTVATTFGHRYLTAGTYDVAITVADDDGGTATITESVVVRDTAPSDIVVDPGAGGAESAVVAGRPTTVTPRLLDDDGVPYPSDPTDWTITDADGAVDVIIDPVTGEITMSSTTAAVHELVLTVPTPFGPRSLAIALTVTPADPARLQLQPSVTSVAVGGSVEFQVSGVDEFGNESDVTDEIVLTSDVSTDVVEGATVRFPTASPHTITATHPSGASASFVITVIPDVTATTTVPSDPTPAPGAPVGELPRTGSELLRTLLLAAGLVLLGSALFGRGRRARRA